MFDFITQELQILNISKQKLNNRKDRELRLSLVRRAFTRYLESNSTAKLEDTVKLIRKETGLKFGNEQGRTFYRELKGISKKANSLARLPRNKRPKLEKIPLIESNVTGTFIYGIKVFIYDKKSKAKLYNLKKSAIRVQRGKYNTVKNFAIRTTDDDIVMTSEEVRAYVYYLIKGQNNLSNRLPDYIETSDYENVLSGQAGEIIGFKYDRIVRT